MTRRLAIVAAALMLLAGCGDDGGDANQIMRETAANLGEIESAKSLDLRFVVDPRDGEEFGFEVHGPFALCGDRDLPVLDIEYTQIASGEEETVRLISTGEDSFIEVDGTAYVLPDEQEAELRGTCEDLEGGFSELRVDDWVGDADADGDNEVSGELDMVAVVNDLGDIAQDFGGSRLSRLDEDDARRLAESVEDSSFELERGDDGLLRHLLLEAELGFDVPDDLRDMLGDVVGGTITFELNLEEPNADVQVDAPANPRPADELGK